MLFKGTRKYLPAGHPQPPRLLQRNHGSCSVCHKSHALLLLEDHILREVHNHGRRCHNPGGYQWQRSDVSGINWVEWLEYSDQQCCSKVFERSNANSEGLPGRGQMGRLLGKSRGIDGIGNGYRSGALMNPKNLNTAFRFIRHIDGTLVPLKRESLFFRYKRNVDSQSCMKSIA